MRTFFANPNPNAPLSDADATPIESTPAGERAGGSRDFLGWSSSLVVHAIVCFALAVATFGEPAGVAVPSLVAEPVAMEQADDSLLVDDLSTLFIEDSESVALADVPLPSDFLTDTPLQSPVSLSELSTEVLLVPISADLSGATVQGIEGRAGDSRAALVEGKGGSKASELAVARGIKWIAEHQNADGSWSLIHSVGSCRGRCPNNAQLPNKKTAYTDSLRSGTALALLPLLGAGETHQKGRYRRTVRRGLRALVQMGKADKEGRGVSWMDSGRMYAHGLAAIVLTEAYGMTRDPELGEAAQAALDFIAYAQHPEGGGWRYTPQQIGDVSVTGWQIMALKSGTLAELNTHSRTAERARQFFDATQANMGERYIYMADIKGEEPRKPTRTLTAVGLLSRMHLGWKRDDPRLVAGLEWLVEKGPSRGNYYHNYYAAQALFHFTEGKGPIWKQWNETMREQLIAQQETRGHLQGSWWVEGAHNNRGGRLYTTALATMTLEVYYRYLPLYQAAAMATEFPE